MLGPEAIKRAHPELADFIIKQSEEGIQLALDGKEVASVLQREDEWILYSEHGHSHCESLEEGLELLCRFLRSEARWAEHFRGETLAAAWIETEVEGGELWERQDLAIFLSPFDEDEWKTQPDDPWRTVRTTWRLRAGRLEEAQFEREGEQSDLRPEEMFGWLETALGPPVQGMKWTVARDNRLALQVPKGWRRLTQSNSQGNYIDFAADRPGLMLRVQNYYRPTAVPAPERNTSVKPTFRDYEREEASEENGGWACDRWTLTYMGDQDDMLAIVELFEHASYIGAAEPFRKKLVDTVGEARYVPNNWNMAKEREGSSEE